MTDSLQPNERTAFKLTLPETKRGMEDGVQYAPLISLVGEADWLSSRMTVTMVTDGSRSTTSSVPTFVQFPDANKPTKTAVKNEVTPFNVEIVDDPVATWLKNDVDRVTDAFEVGSTVKQFGGELAQRKQVTHGSTTPDMAGARNALKAASESLLVQVQCIRADDLLGKRAGWVEDRIERSDDFDELRPAVRALWGMNYAQYDDFERHHYQREAYILTVRVLGGGRVRGQPSNAKAVANRFTASMNGDSSLTTSRVDPQEAVAAVREHSPPQEVEWQQQAKLALPWTSITKPYVASTAAELTDVFGAPE